MSGKDIGLKAERIYKDLGRLIFSIAYDITGDYHAAEDAVQETIRRIIKTPGRADELEGTELRNYVARIAANVSYDYLKKSERDTPVRGEDLCDIEDDFDLEEFVITNSTKERLKEEIKRLDSKYRDPLTLHNLYGHTVPEVSRLLGVPERTVKHRINRAVKILKEVLLKGGGGDER